MSENVLDLSIYKYRAKLVELSGWQTGIWSAVS